MQPKETIREPHYTLTSNGDGTANFQIFTVNPDGSATQTALYLLTRGQVTALHTGLANVINDPRVD